MSLPKSCCFFIAFLLTAIRFASAEEPLRVGLEGKWELTEKGGNEIVGSIPATVPGCVHTDLLAVGKIPDLFYRDNDSKLQWIGNATWIYSRKFDVPPELLRLDHVKLRCDGLDTLATIRVNGTEVAHTDNMFRSWEFDVRSLLRPTDNTIEITFDPPGPYLTAHAQDPAFPGVRLGEKLGKMLGSLRKEQCNFGWDWGPVFTTYGIWKKIGLIGWGHARMAGALIHEDLNDPSLARLDIDITADTDGQIPLESETTVTFGGKEVGHILQPLRQEDGVGRTTIEIKDPQRWWPAGMGAQNLYDVRIALLDREGNMLDQTVRHIGLRTIEWLPKTDQRPLGLSVNGRPFFAKGANWIPPDLFATRVTPELLRHYMTDAASANMNMIRFWGGGYYEEDELYNLCDQLGILIWLDCKFASNAYPVYDPAFRENVRGEIDENLVRLRDHPSIAVWCGNNEVRLDYFVRARGGNGFVSLDDYNRFFTGLIGSEVHQLAPDAVYTPGSPEAGDQHFWGVWHGNQPFEAYEQQHGLMTEFGFESFPEPRTVDSFTTPEDRASVTTPVMNAHQRSPSGDGKILRMISAYFRTPKDFDSTLWLSQICQAYGITRAVENWRRDWPNSTGSIIWQYNDCWPGATWSMVDVFGRWKALMYEIRHSYSPLLVSATSDPDGTSRIFVSTDRTEPCQTSLDWSLTDAAGSELDKGSAEVSVPAGTANVLAATLPLKDQIKNHGAENLLLWMTLSENGHSVSENVEMFAKPKFLQIEDPQIHSDVVESDGGYAVTLKATHAALWTWLNLANTDATYSDNFMHLRPDHTVTILVKPSVPISLDQFLKELKVHSLFDTYDPNANTSIVAQSDDGSIVAPAEMADIEGSSAGLDDKMPSDVSGWETVGDSVIWNLQVKKAGTYSVGVTQSCPPGEDGSAFTISVGDQQVAGVVPATKNWDTYQTATLGTIKIAQACNCKLVVQATSKPHKFVMNLRSIMLKPINP